MKTLTWDVDNGGDRDPEVHSPTHYNQHGIECIHAIEASMTPTEFQGYLKGNTEKYLWRYRYKGRAVQDLEKAEWYLALLKEKVKEFGLNAAE